MNLSNPEVGFLFHTLILIKKYAHFVDSRGEDILEMAARVYLNKHRVPAHISEWDILINISLQQTLFQNIEMTKYKMAHKQIGNSDHDPTLGGLMTPFTGARLSAQPHQSTKNIKKVIKTSQLKNQ